MPTKLKVFLASVGAFVLAYFAIFEWAVKWHDQKVESNFSDGKRQGISDSGEKITNAQTATSEIKTKLDIKEDAIKRHGDAIVKYEADIKQYKDNEKFYVSKISELQTLVRLYSGCPILGEQYFEVNRRLKNLYDDRMNPWGSSSSSTRQETIDKQIADLGIQRKSIEEQLGGCPK